jgi:hypothetical protein
MRKTSSMGDSTMLRWLRRLAIQGCVALAVCTLVLAGPLPAVLAQQSGPTALKNVKVWVNPEYDDAMKLGGPSLLVMIEGNIVGAQAPVTVRFLVPSTASMYSAGSKDDAGTYIPPGDSLDRTSSAIPGWDEVSYELKTATFRVEYYAPVAATSPRQISYQLQRVYPIENLTVSIQEPKRSSGFTMVPAGIPGTDGEGYPVHSVTYANVDVTTPVQFNISYQMKSAPNLLLIVGLVVVAAVLGGGGYYLVKKGGRARPGARAGRRAGSGGQSGKRAATPAYCSQCGRKLDRPGRFCPGCGAEL